MPDEETRRLLHEQIDEVHYHIEECISRYMTKNETIDAVSTGININPDFIKIVWEKLEMDNQDFFRAYHTRLVLRDQITEFNRLLSHQVQLMNGRNANDPPRQQQFPLPNINVMGNNEPLIEIGTPRVYDRRAVASPSNSVESNPDDFPLDMNSYYMANSDLNLTPEPEPEPEPEPNVGDGNIVQPKAEQSDSSDPSSSASHSHSPLGGK